MDCFCRASIATLPGWDAFASTCDVDHGADAVSLEQLALFHQIAARRQRIALGLSSKIDRLMFARIFVWQAMIVGFLAVVLILFWAFAVYRWHVYPYHTLVTIRDFVRGAESDQRSLAVRLKSEFGFNPIAFATTRFEDLVPRADLKPVRASHGATAALPDIDGISYFHRGGPRRVFVVLGSFVFEDAKRNWGVIAVDTDGVVYRAWAPQPASYEFLGAHIGLAVANDGLIVTNIHGVMTGYEWCGGKRWEAPWSPHPDGVRRWHDAADAYDWHHDITVVGDSIYSFRGAAIVEVDAGTGQPRSEIHALDLVRWAWRDDLSIFQTRRKLQIDPDVLNVDSMTSRFHNDPWHFNKVDLLSAAAAPNYEKFQAGDMLLSLRELNLVAVVRPSEQRVIWWRQGLFAGQHDATFVDGHIEIFDNNYHSFPARPRILRLDLSEQQTETLFDLSAWKMKMRIMGNFERRGEQLLTVDDDAGRVIAGRLDGTIDFVLENDWRDSDDEAHRLQVRNATEIDPATFDRWQAACTATAEVGHVMERSE